MKSTASGPGKIRQINRTAVLAHIRRYGENSRLKIGKELGLSAAAMTSVTSELIDEELLRKIGPNKNFKDTTHNKTQGRPISILELNPDKACVFGILLRPLGGICYIESAWADYSGEVNVSKTTIEVSINHYSEIIKGIEDAISGVGKLIPKKSEIYGLSIGIPGVVESQTIPIAPKLACIEDPDFISTLNNTFNFPISFENDVNLESMSEIHIQPRLRELCFAYLHVYSGIGSSIVLEGKVLKGSRGWSGEIGQLGIKHPNNVSPSFEQLLSVEGVLGKLLEDLGHPSDALDLLIPYIDEKNIEVLKITDKYSYNLFNAINVLHSVIDLDEIIIDFQSTKLLKKLLPNIQQLINMMPHKLVISLPTIEHQPGLHGAALNALNLALDKIEKRVLKQ